MSIAELGAELGAEMRKNRTMNYPKCPVCGSAVLLKMGAIEGALRGGITGISKRHRCYNCGHLF
jgi:DNA-directed RNA polymerase subunit RPC12/RpoP